MTFTNEELLRKATLNTGDFGGAGEAPLTVQQVTAFLRIAITPQAMLPIVRTVMSNSAQWEESKIDFGARIMRAGVQGERLVDSDRVAPTTGIVQIITVLIRGEVPVTDEVLEDQVERAGFASTLTTMIAEATGRDVEELFVNGDTGSGDLYLAQQQGWFEIAEDATDNVEIVATSIGQDYQDLFKQMLVQLPDRFKRSMGDLRYFAPQRLVELYTDILAERGTPLGDFMLEGQRTLRYQGIEIVGVPILTVTTGTPDVSEVLLTHRLNCYAGYRRMIKLETFRDPREGVLSFIVSARVNSQIAHTPATTFAREVNVEP